MTQRLSKTALAWIAALGGALGLHRFALRGLGDRWGWLHVLATGVGGYGAWRMRRFGVDDRLGSVLVPLLGASLSAAMLAAIVIALMAEPRWRALHGAGAAGDGRTGPLAVLAAVFALAAGAIAAIATLAFTMQQLFEPSLR